MRILWIANPMESEHDLWRSGQNHDDLDIEVWTTIPTTDPHFTIGARDLSRESRRELLHQVAQQPADLYVFRYPTWIIADDLLDDYHQLFDGRPAIVWMSEQGPTLPSGLTCAKPFHRIAVSNWVDHRLYRSHFPTKRIYHLPFGCADWNVPRFPARLVDLYPKFVADGGCHYACREDGEWKAESVRVMVLPLIDDTDLYGHGPEDHGWNGVPGGAARYRGTFPSWEAAQIYARYRVYVGISWNWAFGGFGTKLARAMATGIPVLWHRTVGMEAEGLVPGLHLLAPSSGWETKEFADWLLRDPDHARRIGEAGRAFALDGWEWGTMLRRLVGKIKAES